MPAIQIILTRNQLECSAHTPLMIIDHPRLQLLDAAQELNGVKLDDVGLILINETATLEAHEEVVQINPDNLTFNVSDSNG